MTNRVPMQGLRMLLIAVALLAPALAEAQDPTPTKLLRFPDIHGDTVVFCYAGDLWTAPVEGGTATRLTTHPGQELFPRFSPDGRWIAFTGQIDGDEQVYVVPSTGGIPVQLTWYPARGPLPPRWGYDNQVYGWTSDGGAVLFRSLRDGWDLSDSRLYTVSVDGGLPEALPMPVSGAGDLSPDGEKVVYSPLFRDFRTWKRYQGGWASDLYIFDLATNEARPITTHERTDRDPMWIDERIVFTSDRDGKLNLYAYDTEGDAISQLTFEDEWDVRWPAADEAGRVIYELAGELHVLALDGGATTKLDIVVPTDGLAKRPKRVRADADVEGWALSPKGHRALIVARGDVFTVPAEHGPTRNLTNSSDAHERLARWSPDGAHVLYVSDRSGEEALYLLPQDGRGEERLLSDEATGRLYNPVFSPDGEHVVYSDKEGVIRVLNVESGRVVEVADEPQGQVTDYVWSPDSSWLAFSLTDVSDFASLHLWSLEDRELHKITGPMFNEFAPAWDPAGDYLFYMSDRGFAPQIGSMEWNYVVDRETGIYALALREDVDHPLPPRSDEVEVEEDDGGESGDSPEEGKSDEAEDHALVIDVEGLGERVVALPMELDNYYGLSALEGKLLFVRGGPFYYGRGNDVTNTIKMFDMEKREVKDVTEAGGYALSHDGEKLLVRARGGFQLMEIAPDAKGSPLSTSDMYCDVDPPSEWETAFDEVWRRFRDFFYVENMHGYDWEAIGDQYRELLPHVSHRSDLNYVIGEMIAELNVSHAYISGGDFEIPDRPSVALPGARLELDEDSGRYRIAEIFPGHNEEGRYRSPLTEVGMDARVGDYVLAIDGEPLAFPQNPYRMLQHRADRPVTFTLGDRPRLEDAREVTFEPRTQEVPLRYLRWVEENRRRVEEATDGRVGYMHIPDMGSNGIREFIKYFYGQLRRDGLVIDVRGNGGGNVSQMLIERLRRELLRVRYVRTQDRPGTYPSTIFTGKMVCLLNETSASDGDIFPAMFRKAGLGPLIGKRSWGGVIGITNHGPLIDGGSVNVPQFGTNDKDTGEWVIEGYGVEPDIVVENPPSAVIAGQDPQLERAIAEVMAQIEADPPVFPDRPADPVRTQ